MFVVDTNVLVYAGDGDAPEYSAARERLSEWTARPEPWGVTWSIVYEFLRVVTHPRVLRRPWSVADGWAFMEPLLGAPSLRVLTETDRHDEVLGAAIADMPRLSGNLVHDAHIAVLMREHGVRRIMTLDGDFHRFPWIEVIDPLA